MGDVEVSRLCKLCGARRDVHAKTSCTFEPTDPPEYLFAPGEGARSPALDEPAISDGTKERFRRAFEHSREQIGRHVLGQVAGNLLVSLLERVGEVRNVEIGVEDDPRDVAFDRLIAVWRRADEGGRGRVRAAFPDLADALDKLCAAIDAGEREDDAPKESP